MDYERYSPFNIDIAQKVKSPIPPDDLKPLINQLFQIPRFVDNKYPPGIFSDNVGDHVFRLIAIIDAAKIDLVDTKILERIFWVHDIPELIIGEYITFKKESNSQFAKNLEIKELEAAKQLLPPSDVQLIQILNASGKFLKGQGELFNVTSEGLVAVTADKIDGNMFFHYSLVKWIGAGDGKREFPSRTGMEYTFKQRELFLTNLDKLSQEYSGGVKICRNLLDYQMKYIVEAWDSVPAHKQPEIIKEQLRVHALKKNSGILE